MHVVMARRAGSWWGEAASRKEINMKAAAAPPTQPPEGRMLHIVGPRGWSRLPHLEGVGSLGGGRGESI